MKKITKIKLTTKERDFISKIGKFVLDLWNYSVSEGAEGHDVFITIDEFHQIEQFADELDEIITNIQCSFIKPLNKNQIPSMVETFKEIIKDE